MFSLLSKFATFFGFFASFWKVKILSNFPPKKVQDWIIWTFHKPNNFPNCSPFGRSFCWPMSHLFWSTSLPNVTIGLYQTSTFLHKIYAQFCTFSQNRSYVYNIKQRQPYIIFYDIPSISMTYYNQRLNIISVIHSR